MYTLVFCLSNIWHSKQRPDWCELAERSGNLALKPCSIQLCSALPLSSFLLAVINLLLCHRLLALSLFPCSVIVPSFSALPLCSPRNIIMTISQLQISIKRSLNTRAHTHSRSFSSTPHFFCSMHSTVFNTEQFEARCVQRRGYCRRLTKASKNLLLSSAFISMTEKTT